MGPISKTHPDDADIYELFHVEHDITGGIVGGYRTKYALCKNPYYGNHNSYGKRGVDVRDEHYHTSYKLHHFKWDETVLERMRHRVENKDRFPYWENFQRFLDYYEEHGRIPLDGGADHV